MGLSATHVRAKKLINVLMYVIDIVILAALGTMIVITTYYLIETWEP